MCYPCQIILKTQQFIIEYISQTNEPYVVNVSKASSKKRVAFREFEFKQALNYTPGQRFF